MADDPRVQHVLDDISESGCTPEEACADCPELLPEEEREVFDLVRIQGMTQTEAAQLLDVSVATVKRRLNRGLRLLGDELADLRPGERPPDSN
jgi:RNA polymerase sigma-70 factor (ECF subfamily)